MRSARVSLVLVVAALAALALLVACSKQEPASTPPAASTAPGPAPASTGWTPESKPPQSLQVETSADVFNRQGVLKRVHFDTDKYDIRTEDRQILKDNAVWLLAHSQFKLTIEGHCDERNTESYNLALGERRANAAKEYLAGLGISPTKIQTVSFGKSKPACTTSDEGCWSQNRRSEFILVDDK
jgi:peptidoglycan-associated lipoprotein